MTISDDLRAFLILFCVVFIVGLSIGIYNYMKSPQLGFTSKESFGSAYDKEMELFQSLDSGKQQEYLNMSRSEKMAKYKRQLM